MDDNITKQAFGDLYAHYLNKVWNPKEWYKDYKGLNRPAKDDHLTRYGRYGLLAPVLAAIAIGGVKAAPALGTAAMSRLPQAGSIGKLLARGAKAAPTRSAVNTGATSWSIADLIRRLAPKASGPTFTKKPIPTPNLKS